MTSSNRQHIRYSPITEADNIFSFAPPEDVHSRNGAYPSYVPSTQLSEMTELSGGPTSLSSHSRNLTTGPTATSISFPITPNSDGPPSPLSPSHGSMMEQRFNSIQSRIAPTPSTGASGGMMFTFVPPPEELASSRPATYSQLSSIAESTAPNSFHRDTIDLEDGLPEVGPLNSSIGKASKNISSSSDFTAPVSPTPAEVPTTRYLDSGIGEDEDSPYAEVRACVSNVDDPDMPCLTWRMWTVGLVLAVLMSSSGMYFFLRYPSPPIGFSVLLVCTFLFGKALELLPIRSWDIGPFVFELNPGPFNIKEHTAAFILCSTASGIFPSMTFIIASEKKYNTESTIGFQLLLLLSCQLVGFSLGGIFRHLLVRPAWLIWPSNLSTCAMVNMFHAGYDDDNHRGLARLSFFGFVTLGATLYSFIPGFLFTGLSYFSFLCWIWPNNKVVNQLFGTVTGLGMTGLTFDWNQIALIANPMITPWWALAHIFAGFVLFYWILSPLLYYIDVWKTGHLPIMGYFAYDRFAKPYAIDRIIDQSTMRLNATAYEEYSQLYLTVTFSMTYMLAFITPTLLVTHAALNYGPNILGWLRNDREAEANDIHAKLMQRYPDTPTWWYLVLFAISFPLLFITLKIEPGLDTPVWMALLVIAQVMVFLLPSIYLYATAGSMAQFTVISQAISGIVLPGRPLPNMLLKTTVPNITFMSLVYLRWLKLGHYMKIPPRANFCVHIVAIFVSNFTQVGVKKYLFATVKDICQPGQKSQLTCASIEAFYTASVVWGVIGPARMYGRGGLYFPQVFGLLIGALLPIPFWWWSRRRPKSPLRHFHLPIFFLSNEVVPPATGINLTSFFLVGFIFQYVIRKRRFQWWSRYNYILSGALDLGTLCGLLILFFAIQLPKQGNTSLNWWGNTVWQNTADAKGVPFFPTDPVHGFAAAPNAELRIDHLGTDSSSHT